MIESTCSRRDAASVIFNLPDHHVIDAVDLPSWGCRVITQADSVSDGCSDCGVVSERVHAWCRQRVKDIPHTDGVELILAKPRLVCGERACPRRTFTQTTPELPLRARCTSRLRRGVLETRPTRCWCRGDLGSPGGRSTRASTPPSTCCLAGSTTSTYAAWGSTSTVTVGSAGSAIPTPAGRTMDDGLGQCRFRAGPRNR